MKKLLLLCCMAFAYSKVSYAQEGYYGENLNSSLYTASQVIGNSAPQSPDAAAFQKVNFVPVSNYTGRATIGIPIYTISVGKMSVPISLSYNTSGVKVNDMASNVGLNWSLNAGGMISKMTKGMDDFHRLRYNGSTPISNDMESAGWLSYVNATQYIGWVHPYNDAQPDVFTVNAPGLSTKYVYRSPYTNNNGVVNVSTTMPDAVELENRGNIINVTSFESYAGNDFRLAGFGNTDITSIEGIKYSFGSKETSKSYPAYKSKYSTLLGPEMTTVSSYRLDKMFDASSNQTINFEYEEYTVNFYDEIKQKGSDYNGGTDISFNVTGTSKTVYPTLQRLTKITFEKGSVEFIYGLNRVDNPDEKALTEIKVKNNLGEVIKHIKLAYSYFQTTLGSSSSAQSKRLRLDRVYEVDASQNELPGHTFTYNTAYQMAPRGSYAHDFLGYNNGSYTSSNTNPIPNYYLSYNNTAFDKEIKISPFYNASAVLIPGNFSLEANADYAKTYTLKKITFPTGGENEYEYELNQFTHDGVTRQGGGIRIKSQKLNDGRGNTQILDYTYESGNIANFPVFAFIKGTLPNNGITNVSQLGLGITTFLAPQSQIEFTQGAFVGYNKVTVKNRVNNGYTVYNYSSPGVETYRNLRPTITYDNSNAISSNWSVITPPSLFVDRDFLRGRVLLEEIYNANGDVRLEKEYIYTQKQFSTMTLSYLNKSSSTPSDNCYYSNGKYKLNQGNCGGYYENISLPIERSLLTKVITRDYQAGNIVYTQGGTENIPFTFETIKKYEFDKQFPLLLKESKEVFVCKATNQGGEQDCDIATDDYDNNIIKTYVYPKLGGMTSQGNTISTLPLANDLVLKNRLSTPLKISYNGIKEHHIYKNFPNGIIALEKINFEARNGTITESDKVTKRDAKGRVIEYLRKDGIYVARIYGYENWDYLVAEIVNSTHADALYGLQNGIQTPFNQGTFDNDFDLRNMFNELRALLPDTQITSYTYKPLIGINCVTDVRGRTMYYHYDSFNRLESVTDHEGKVISKNSYHYKNQ